MNCDDIIFKLLLFNLFESIILKFFFFFNIFKALFSIPLQIITSKYIFFSSNAKFFLILKLQATIPPNALIGSHASACLKLFKLFLFIETPHGLAWLIIAVPMFLGNDLEIISTDKKNQGGLRVGSKE